MLREKGETRPLCKWRDHKWKPGDYFVFIPEHGSSEHTVVARKVTCRKCGAFRFRTTLVPVPPEYA